jgi:hypothetical protein
MNRPSWLAANFLIYILLVLVAASMQTSLFHWVLGWKATIQIVLLLLTYICLYREPGEALFFTVLAGYCMGLLSTMMESIAVFGAVCVFIGLRTLRTRVYSPSHVYFTWTGLGSIFSFHIITWLTGVFFETHAPRPRVLDWVLEILMTALFARAVYVFCNWIDVKTKKVSVTELNT